MKKNKDSELESNEIKQQDDNEQIKEEQRADNVTSSDECQRTKQDTVKNIYTSDSLDEQRPKLAQWKVLPPSDIWCPDSLSNIDEGLKSNQYINNYARLENAIDGWKILGATRRGKLHAHNGTHREDAYDFAVSKDFVIACVADGAGSSKYSRIGSYIVCRDMIERLKPRIEELMTSENKRKDEVPFFDPFKEMIKEEVRNVCNHIDKVAKKATLEPRDFRCTLLLTILMHVKDKDYVMATQVGDGAILCLRFNGETELLTKGDSGAYSGEVSCFIPDSSAPENTVQKFSEYDADQISALLMCSDGIDDPFYPIAKNPAPIFQQFYGGVKEPLNGFASQNIQGAPLTDIDAEKGLQTWIDFEKRGENDDRTLLACYRDPSKVDPETLIYRK